MFENRSGEVTSSGWCRSGRLERAVLGLSVALAVAGCSATDAAVDEESTARTEQAASVATSCGYSVATGTYSKWRGTG
jgi:hypothetical protein